MDAWLLGAALLGGLGSLAVGVRLGRNAIARVRAAASWRESVRRAAEADQARALEDLEAQTAELLRRHRLEAEITKPAPPAVVARMLSTPTEGHDLTRTYGWVPDPPSVLECGKGDNALGYQPKRKLS